MASVSMRLIWSATGTASSTVSPSSGSASPLSTAMRRSRSSSMASDLLGLLAVEVAEVGVELVLEHGEVGLAVLVVDRRDDVGREVDDLLEVLRRDVEQVAQDGSERP